MDETNKKHFLFASITYLLNVFTQRTSYPGMKFLLAYFWKSWAENLNLPEEQKGFWARRSRSASRLIHMKGDVRRWRHVTQISQKSNCCLTSVYLNLFPREEKSFEQRTQWSENPTKLKVFVLFNSISPAKRKQYHWRFSDCTLIIIFNTVKATLGEIIRHYICTLAVVIA